jgi:hypothetical protein
MNKKLLPWLITFCALGLGGTAAYYSIIGLSKLFAGVATAVIIMASFLEISKLTLATYLHSYWVQLGKLSKLYYTTSVVILSFITSIGIYGMLSHGYQETATKSLNADAQVTLLENKKQNFIQQRDLYSKEKDNLIQGITQLQSGLANNKTSFIDKKGNLVQSTSNANRKSFEKQLDNSNARQSEISTKLDVINDSIFKLDTQIIETKTTNNTAGELGPLKYLSNLTGASMDNIINWLLLVIIFIFDPLAIALVIAANFAFEQIKIKEKSKFIAPNLIIPESEILEENNNLPVWDENLNPNFSSNKSLETPKNVNIFNNIKRKIFSKNDENTIDYN